MKYLVVHFFLLLDDLMKLDVQIGMSHQYFMHKGKKMKTEQLFCIIPLILEERQKKDEINLFITLIQSLLFVCWKHKLHKDFTMSQM